MYIVVKNKQKTYVSHREGDLQVTGERLRKLRIQL